MSSFNNLVMLGNLTADPELRYTQSGATVASFTLALNSKFTRQNGEKGEDVAFVPVTVWGKLAEIVCEYLRKGRQALVCGRITESRWEDKETGKQRSKLECTASSVVFTGAKPQEGQGGEEQQPEPEHQQKMNAGPRRPAANRGGAR